MPLSSSHSLFTSHEVLPKKISAPVSHSRIERYEEQGGDTRVLCGPNGGEEFLTAWELKSWNCNGIMYLGDAEIAETKKISIDNEDVEDLEIKVVDIRSLEDLQVGVITRLPSKKTIAPKIKAEIKTEAIKEEPVSLEALRLETITKIVANKIFCLLENSSNLLPNQKKKKKEGIVLSTISEVCSRENFASLKNITDEKSLVFHVSVKVREELKRIRASKKA